MAKGGLKKNKSSIAQRMKRFHEPLALMLFAHQALYEALGHLIARLMNCRDDKSDAVLAHIRDFEARIDLFSQLANFELSGSPRLLAKVKSLVDALDAVNGQRNNIVHGKWEGIPVRSLSLKRPKPRSERFALRPYKYTALQIRRLARRMWRLYLRLGTFDGVLIKRLPEIFQFMIQNASQKTISSPAKRKAKSKRALMKEASLSFLARLIQEQRDKEMNGNAADRK
jgi:hypothetical protein